MIPCNNDGACIAFERPAFKRHEMAKTRPSLSSAVDKFRRIRRWNSNSVFQLGELTGRGST